MTFYQQRPNEIVEVNRWGEKDNLEVFPEGSRDKHLVFSPEKVPFSFLLPNHAYLMKFAPNRAPQEYFAEIIAYKIGTLMGLDVPHAFLAVDGTRTGVLSQWFYDFEREENASRFLHVPGGDIARKVIDGFDRNRGTEHNIKLLLQMGSFIELVSKKISFKVLGRPYEDIVKMLTFDTLIGNTDRHQDNWSILYDAVEKTIRFSPIFDNGSSLGFDMHDRKAAFKCDAGALERYVSRGKHHVRWDNVSNKRMKHFELLEFLCRTIPEASTLMQEALDFNLAEVEAFMYELQEFEVQDKLSSERIVFIISLIKIRDAKIREIVDRYKNA